MGKQAWVIEEEVDQLSEDGSLASEGKPCAQVINSNSPDDNDPFYIKGLDERAADDGHTQFQQVEAIPEPKKTRSFWSYLCFAERLVTNSRV